MERCNKCKKKSIVIQKCTCEKSLCLACRHPEDHGCTYDRNVSYKEVLSINNPKIVAKKVESI